MCRQVDFVFKRMGDDCTYVTIRNYGFKNGDDELPDLFNDLAGVLQQCSMG